MCLPPPSQGALYCLLGNHIGVCLANLHDWDCIVQTWPAIVRSGLSSAMSLEKPSVVRLFDDLADKVHRQYETIGLDFAVRASTFLLWRPRGCITKQDYTVSWMSSPGVYPEPFLKQSLG